MQKTCSVCKSTNCNTGESAKLLLIVQSDTGQVVEIMFYIGRFNFVSCFYYYT